ncbi:MAG: chemotaxis protein methyltransferase WspC [Gammaproteobacteria bacterium]|jgi:chemotaxis protein methyltransferase WspC|nr:chemotaxis protein methyltransferase WspC [Gammaproteobacteria bacterium]
MQRALESLLQQAMGLDVMSIGTSAVERAVQARMQACNRSDMQAYVELVRASGAELQQLIETIVVPETWFGRDPQAFALLSRWAFESWLPDSPHGQLRLLSLPCSTGEEPYSMAMTLLEAGFPAGRLSIDAVDISERSLAVARRAIYGKNSFRGAELAFRGHHFDETAAGWQLRESVQALVHFQQGNLFADDFLPGAERYDAIFCRNVLIYFDRATQDRAIAVLQRLLARKAIVFVGPSETSLLLSHGFAPIKAPLAFAFQKPDKAAAKKPTSRVATSAPARPPTPPQSRASAPVEPQADVRQDGLDAAVELADAGRFAEAAALCAEHVKRSGASARAFRLIAMIRAEAGDSDAAAANYRSALYLDPNDYEALIHLGLLLEKRGDASGAGVLFRRAKRIESRSIGGATP